MASTAYENVCSVIYERLYTRLERKDESLRFAAWQMASEVLNDDQLQLFFLSLSLSDSGITQNAFIRRVKDRQLHGFLATLIFATCSIDAAKSFITNLVEPGDWPPPDLVRSDLADFLPCEREQLVSILGNGVDADRFLSQQAIFCPLVILNKEEVKIDDNNSRRLPYLEELPLGEGAFGKVFKVKIARGYFCDPQSKTGSHYNTSPTALARKDYIMSGQVPNSRARTEHTQEEHEIMRIILSQSSGTCKNIVESFGSFHIGIKYSLFMELAVCDLRAYMSEVHPAKLEANSDKADVIRCAEGLAAGLHFLHNEMRAPNMERLVCYHMDLKPCNILVFKEAHNGTDEYIWKISDFGMARIKIRHQDQTAERERNFNGLFVQRPTIHDPSLSGTLNRRGEGSYLSPESISNARKMNTSSDVWSLGCVLSVVFAYLEDGWDGVACYQQERLRHRGSDDYDRFFLRGNRFTRAQVHPEVGNWHTRLIKKASRRSSGEADALSIMLRGLEKKALAIDQSQRGGVQEVMHLLKKTFQFYMSLDLVHSVPADQPVTITDTMRRLLFPRRQCATDKIVNTYYISSPKSFKGCDISPDASVVAYWTDNEIVLYTSESLNATQKASPSWKHKLEASGYFWKSVALTKKYLIASTTGGDKCFDCYIFHLQGGRGVDANLNEYRRVTLSHYPEIHKLSMSPNSRTFVCVIRGGNGNREPGTLLHVSLRELWKYAGPRASVLTQDTGILDIDRALKWRKVPLESPAGDVRHLSVSDSDDVHMVIRPEPTLRSREHTIPILRVSFNNSTINALSVESLGFDSSSTVGFFTTFCPFHTSASCAVVTREKRFHIQTFDTDTTQDVQIEIRTHRILKLMMNRQDDKLFALGTRSATERVLLLEMDIPNGNSDAAVRELAPLPGLSYSDDFVVRLVDEGAEKCILVATLSGANRRAIYKVRLSGNDNFNQPGLN